MTPSLRLATEDDLPALAALYAQLHPGDESAPPARLASALAEILSSSRHFEIVVAEVDGVVAATCYLNLVPNLTRGARPYAVIENVVVDRSLRGRGLGRQVIGFALARAWARGCYKAMLQTGSKSESTLGFYRRCGFSQTEKTAFVARPEAA